MKYIRTNKGKIYECVGEDENGYDCDTRRLPLKHALTKVAKQKFYYGVEYAIKVADTIEELCDEFVIKVNVHNIVVHDLESALNLSKDYKNNELTKEYIIYGATWTDKGLIYVAKINEKGDLCLL